MEHFRRRSSADNSVNFLNRVFTRVSIQRSKSPSVLNRSEPCTDVKGPLGLNLLYSPPEPLVEFIFVHGLGGGSKKSWSKTADSYHYWPKEWLPRDLDFQNVRIYSFGYVADWGERKNSILEVEDFACSLLAEMKDNPGIRREETQIVMIGHSMGGLVIKKVRDLAQQRREPPSHEGLMKVQAYILAREDPMFKDISSRFHTMYFLATPHRGSDLARTLSNILRVSLGPKPYVSDLLPSSKLLSGINEKFLLYAQDLQLWSFYETLETSLLISKAIVVDKASATLGYPHERIALLNSDHRGICKFDRPSDPNYRTLRNALSTTVDAITTEAFRRRREATQSDLQHLTSLTGVSGPPSDDLLALENVRMPGSCEWFTSKKEFEEWCTPCSSTPSVLWLRGNPGSGKSVLSSYVVRCLQKQPLDCSYFFFKQGLDGKSSVSDCLRSLAYQMALCNVEVRKNLLAFEADGKTFEKSDERTIWEKLFSNKISKAESHQSHYWVVDALDECDDVQSFFSIISKNPSYIWLRVLITSRKTQEIERAFGPPNRNVTQLEMFLADTVEDIKLFIAARIDQFPVQNSESRASRAGLAERILAKSGGSFLWVGLVVHELEQTWSEEAIEEVLTEIPADMNLWYTRTLEKISKVGRTMKLARAILKWTLCASRPLTLSEMQCALKLDIGEMIHSLDRSISSVCGQLVFVDQQSRVQIIHQTARDFLLQGNLNSEFAVRKAEGHASLAIKCLESLSGTHSKGLRDQKQKFTNKRRLAKDSALVEYACAFFSDHLNKASSLELALWDALNIFLSSAVLSWVEHLAKAGDLYLVTRTALRIKAYLARLIRNFPLAGQQVQTVQAWSVDLIRLSVKFRTALLTSPSSIYWLIPPMCPSESIIAQLYTSPHRGLVVKGLKSKIWDDCLAQISYRGSQATAIDHGDRYFAVGLSTGRLTVYQSLSGHVNAILEHLEKVKILKFGGKDEVLASSGLRTVRIWDLNTGQQLWSFETLHQALAMSFTSENEFLMAATQGGYVTCWCLSDGGEKSRIQWHDGCKKASGKIPQGQPPTHASFTPDCDLVAVGYRGRPITLFDLESEVFFGNCVQRDSSINNIGAHYPIVAMAFNPNSDVGLLIVSYGDGELIVFNSWTVEPLQSLPSINAQTLACSADGRNLVTGSAFGIIQLFHFDEAGADILTMIYRIHAYEEGIKSLTFSNDGLRFIDIHGSQCGVWELTVLLSGNWKDCDRSESSNRLQHARESVGIVEGEIKADITAMVCHPDGDVVFCGKQDGSVVAYLTQDGRENCVLYKHATNIAVTSIAWGQRKSILASVDESSRIIIRRIVKVQAGWSAPDTLVDQHCAGSIRGLLVSPGNDRLLVSGENFAELWTIQGHKVGSKNFEAPKGRTVIYHPLQPAAFITLEADLAKIFNWADFRELTDPAGINLNSSSAYFSSNPAVMISCQGINYLVALFKISGNHALTKLECWQTWDLQEEVTSITAIPGLDVLGPSVEHVIAVDENSILFLDTDLWVCSLDLNSFVAKPEARRYFFIPAEWQRNLGHLLFQLTARKEFVFAKGNELAIIKRGMENFETIPLSLAHPLTINEGSKPQIMLS